MTKSLFALCFHPILKPNLIFVLERLIIIQPNIFLSVFLGNSILAIYLECWFTQGFILFLKFIFYLSRVGIQSYIGYTSFSCMI